MNTRPTQTPTTASAPSRAPRQPPDAHEPPSRVFSPILIGRDAEFESAWTAVLRPPALIAVEGEAGVGKSRFVAEVTARAAEHDHRVLSGQAHPLREPFPLGPLIDAIRPLREEIAGLPLTPVTGALRPLLPELADLLPEPADRPPDRASERHQMFRAVVEILAGLGPSVLVLEDMHWADETTWEFLRYLPIHHPEQLSVMLIFRREDLADGAMSIASGGRRPVEHIRLNPLNAEEVRELVAAILQTETVTIEFASYLHERTAGLPFVIEEALSLLQQRRDVVRHGNRWARKELDELDVPTGVQEAVHERLARVREGARKVVEAAAVLDSPSPQDVLQAVSGLTTSSLPAALSEALDTALLHDRGGGVYGLRHALATQSVYRTISSPERRALHERAARALEQQHAPLPVAQLAHHFRRAGDTAGWLRYAEEAADRALSVGEDAVAATFLEQMLGSDGLPAADRERIALKLGTAALHGLTHNKAIALLNAVVDDDRMSTTTKGDLRLSLGMLLYQAGDAVEGREQIKRSVVELEAAPALQARAMKNLATPWVLEGDEDEHLMWLDRARQLSATLDDEALTASVAGDRAAILISIGDRHGYDLVERVGSTGSNAISRNWVSTLSNLALGAVWTGHYERATEFVDEGLGVSEELGYTRLMGPLQSTALLIEWLTSRWEGIDERVRDLARVTADIPHASLATDLVTGSLSLARGDFATSEASYQAAAAASAETGSIPPLVAAAAGRARIRLAEGDKAGAADIAEEALRLVATKKIWVWAAEGIEVAVAALCADRRPEDAARWLTAFERGVATRDSPTAIAGLTAAKGHLAEASGDWDGAIATYLRASSLFGEFARAYDKALMLEAAGRCKASTSDATAEPVAVEQLLEALKIFEYLGATGDAARVRRLVRSLGMKLPRPWRGGRQGYGNELSPREREVARLAARGRTNQEIADELFLSPWTVANHVRKTLTKLNLKSRRDLSSVDLS
ncbi:MAG TPA: AAA family ATPase [Actinomycetota bacterium]|nr:AAA family ATPase [Actinomycetota bacterium]